MRSTAELSINVLGPMEVLVDGTAADLPSRRQRALLAALVVRHGRPVSVTDLIDAVWDDDPPARARTTLQTYVSRLRGMVGPDAIVHSPAGYCLDPTVASDLDDVRRSVRALERFDPGDPRIAEMAEHALAAWRGAALSEFEEIEWFRPAVVELREMRANLVDLAAEGMIRQRRCPEAVSMLEISLASEPLREPTQVLLVMALHEAGRTTDAVRAASRYRDDLRDTTGLLPGAAFVEVERLVLTAGEAASAGSVSADPETSRWTSATLQRPTPLIGRAKELASVRDAIASSRLVTVVGTGGVGKTRLVAELVEQAATSGRVLSIELAPVVADRVTGAFGSALGVRDERVEPQHLADVIGSEPMVIVVDNVEHVLDPVRDLVRHLLSACSDVRFLVTSRERLDLTAETVVALEPLGVDGPDADAVTLFVDRLRRARSRHDVDPHDPTILEMCRRLDGIPLALELAASRAATLGVSVLNDRFDSMFGRLADVDIARHRHSTLGNVVAWSIELLGPQARRLLAALSVFNADFTMDAVETVGRAIDVDDVPTVFGRLVDTSLVHHGAGAGRFRLLEMIREVGRQRLAASAHVAEAHRAHAEWVADQVLRIRRQSVGPDEAETLDRLDALRPELFPALAWSLESGNVAIAASIVAPLAGPMLYRPDHEMISAIRGIGDHRSIAGSPHEPSMLAADARAALLLGDLDDVTPLADRAYSTVTEADLATRHRAEHALGVLSLYRGDFEESRRRFEPVVDDAAAEIVDRLDALGGLALARCYSGDLDAARDVAAELRAAAETIASDTYVAFADYALAEVELGGGDVERAAKLLEAAADRAWRAHARFVWGVASTVLARVLVRHRPPTEAREQLPILIDRWRRTATWTQLWTTLRLAAEHLADTDLRVALLILDAADHDGAAPSPSDDDREIHVRLRDTARAELGDAVVTGIAHGASVLDRTEILDRALATLRTTADD